MSPIRSAVHKQGARIYIVRAPPRVPEQKADRVAYALTVGGLFLMSSMALYDAIRRRRIARDISKTTWGRDDMGHRDEK